MNKIIKKTPFKFFRRLHKFEVVLGPGRCPQVPAIVRKQNSVSSKAAARRKSLLSHFYKQEAASRRHANAF